MRPFWSILCSQPGGKGVLCTIDTGLWWFEFKDAIETDDGILGITDCSLFVDDEDACACVDSLVLLLLMLIDAIEEERDTADPLSLVDEAFEACWWWCVPEVDPDSAASIVSTDCKEDTKWTITFSFPFTLLKIAFFSNGKSILLREFGSFSFDIMIRLLSNGKLTRPTWSLRVLI